MKGNQMKRFLRRRRKRYPRPKIHWTAQIELSEMAAIEALSAHTPWTQDSIQKFLDMDRVIGRCAEWKGRIVGFAIYKLWEDDQTIVLIKLTVHPKFRRRHIGRAIMQDITRRNPRRRIVTDLNSWTELAHDAAVAHQFLVACDSQNGIRQNAIRINT